METKFGRDVVDDLEARAAISKHWTDEEIAALRTYYKEKINDIKRGTDPQRDSGLAMSALFSDLREADGVSETLPESGLH
jgi:hypothetical protein